MARQTKEFRWHRGFRGPTGGAPSPQSQKPSGGLSELEMAKLQYIYRQWATAKAAMAAGGVPNSTEDTVLASLEAVMITVDFVPVAGVLWKVVRVGWRVISMSKAEGQTVERQWVSESEVVNHHGKHVEGRYLNKAGELKFRDPDMPEFTSLSAYRDGGSRFMGDRPTPTSMTGIRDRDGSTVRFDPKAGYCGMLNEDGKITTFFRPDRGEAYFWDNIDRLITP